MLTRKQHDLLLLIHDRMQAEGIPPSFEEMKEALDLKSKSGIHRLITALEERGFIRRLPNRARALEVIRLPEGFDPSRQSSAPGAPDASAASGHGFQPSVVGGLDSSAHGAASAKAAGNVTSVDFAGRSHERDAQRKGGIAGRYAQLNTHADQRPAAKPGSSHGDTSGGFSESAGGFDVPVMGRIAAGVPIAAIQEVTHTLAVPPSMIGMGKHFALEVQGDSMVEAGILDGDTVIIQETPTAEAGDIIVALVDDEEATLKKLRKQDGKIALEACNPAYETRVLSPERVKIQGKLAGLVRTYQ